MTTSRFSAPATDPRAALAGLLARLAPVGSEGVSLRDAVGRVLAEPVRADRASPACDVSAMDGYAVRVADAAAGRLAVAGEVVTGQAPPPLPPGRAMRIFTGGAVPAEGEAIIAREHVAESPDAITIPPDLALSPGGNIRRVGENLSAGEMVVPAGAAVTPAVVAALATFGVAGPRVHRRVRVTVITTGDEVLPPDADPAPWQLRDGNGPFLRSLLGDPPWIELLSVRRLRDDPEALRRSLTQALSGSDAIILTGGVSMGDHDYVPGAVGGVGCEIVFHKLPIRPGKPILAAVGPAGQAILGLPGNPVSVMATARRFALPALRRLGGWGEPDSPPPAVELVGADDRTLSLWWYRGVRLVGPGRAELVATMGSGDVVSAARADGIVELPPGAAGAGPWPFYGWRGE